MHTLLCAHVSNDELIEWALTLKSLSLFALTLLLILLLLMFSIIPDLCFKECSCLKFSLKEAFILFFFFWVFKFENCCNAFFS